ncbi:carboxymuconolactone decarboxylase family protein [Pseudomonas sp. XS1P51]
MSFNTQPTNLLQSIPQVFESLTQVHVTLDSHDLPASLKHLIHLRASQINQCGFCVKMHTREAREANETNLRGDLREHFDDARIGALTAEIGMINLWNRLQVSRH